MNYPLLLLLAGASVLASCGSGSKVGIVDENFAFAARQITYAFTEIGQAIAAEPEESRAAREERGQGPLVSPRSIGTDGSLHMVPSRDWTSGFFPGELWYLYEYTGAAEWEEEARRFTSPIEREKTNGGTHDMGFKIYCSFGNGYRLTGDRGYREIMLEAARTLTTRYNPDLGVIRSWDHNGDKWRYPVIIDNMMNLELLFWAARESGDRQFYDIAVSHALTTMRNHFRDDYSTYHVVDYDPATGGVLNRHTHQGYAHESTWSRGEAWALYGYTMCYRETGLDEFLAQAENVAGYIFNHPNLPDDLILYWDYDAPGIPDEPRDASAAAITASALYEMSRYATADRAGQYKEWADRIIASLSSPAYRAEEGTNRGFLLMHSTGAGNFEVDRPLVYADYYFLEALLRKARIEQGKPLFQDGNRQ
ncbi:MAG: glycoside hydrolase family 88 protein [Rikenellaceae bacterium]|nr:glycoside hydrolase family 88 protein [Rikenellaceae bacterium]